MTQRNLGTQFADTLLGLDDAREILIGLRGDDILIGDGSDGDVFVGGNGNDLLIGGGGDDNFRGGNGWDQVSYVHATRGVTVSLAASDAQDTGFGMDRLSSIEWLSGSTFNDVLRGSSTGDQFYGNDGDDAIIAGGGDDILQGGNGDDLLNGGSGTDLVAYWDAGGGVTVDLRKRGEAQDTGGGGTDTLYSIENVHGGSYDDALTGTSGANVIFGFAGDDQLFGFGGIDTIDGGAGDDLIEGGRGGDTLYGGDGNDVIRTGDSTNSVGPDTLANIGIDVAFGGAGDDTIIGVNRTGYELDGGAGNDTLELYINFIATPSAAPRTSVANGGNGADTFLVHFDGGNYSQLVLNDFDTAEGDTLDLSAFNGIVTQVDAFTASGVGEVVVSTAERVVSGGRGQPNIRENRWLVEIDEDGNGTVDHFVWLGTNVADDQSGALSGLDDGLLPHGEAHLSQPIGLGAFADDSSAEGTRSDFVPPVDDGRWDADASLMALDLWDAIA